MCQYPSFVSTWKEGCGLQVFASPTLESHAGAIAHHKLDEAEPTLLRWNVELPGGAVVLSHDQGETGETARTLAEMQRLWPMRDKLLVHLVSGLGEISVESRGYAAMNAACNGHLACLRAMLASGDISAADRGDAARNAACNGHLACLRAVLMSGDISAADRGAAARNAARNGHTACEKLLNSGGA
jgi:hypothetical protein